MTLADKVLKPRCPKCGKVQADWVKEAQFTCPRCHLTFIIQPPVYALLTKQAISDSVKSSN